MSSSSHLGPPVGGADQSGGQAEDSAQQDKAAAYGEPVEQDSDTTSADADRAASTDPEGFDPGDFSGAEDSDAGGGGGDPTADRIDQRPDA